MLLTPKENIKNDFKLELGTTDHSIVRKQIDSMNKNLAQYTETILKENVVEWGRDLDLLLKCYSNFGFDETKNLVHATGLGWQELHFAPSIGKIINDVITIDKRNETNADILLFSSFFQG